MTIDFLVTLKRARQLPEAGTAPISLDHNANLPIPASHGCQLAAFPNAVTKPASHNDALAVRSSLI